MFLALLALLPAAAPPKPLAITALEFRQYEGGPAVAENFRFGTGETVCLSFKIAGFSVSKDGKIDLAYHIDAMDAQGTRVTEPADKELQATLSAEDKNWMPIIRYSFVIPPLALPGTYRVLISVEDKLAQAQAKADAALLVRGRNVAPSDTLAVRNFRFLRTEDDQHPLDPPAYRPGDILWGRFEMVGYRYGEKNRIEVEYGLAVLGPTGKTLYTEPRAAVERDESFYPKRYLPGILSLNLQKNAQPGTYAIVLTVRDLVGNQIDESRHEFRIEQ